MTATAVTPPQEHRTNQVTGLPRATCGTPLDAVRAVAVVFGGSAVLDAVAAAALVSAAHAIARRRTPSRRAAAGVAATAAYAATAVPWMRRWGSTPADRSKPLPGDELVPDAGIVTTRAVVVDAPPAEVWKWLAQIGQDRAGFYSITWLEDLAGCAMPDADAVHEEWQHRKVGELVPLHPAHGIPVAHFAPGHALVLDGWGAFVVEPEEGVRTRLLARGRVRRGLPALFYVLAVEIPHFVMERRMLLGIKERAERLTAALR